MGDSISISDRAKKRYNINFSCRTLDVRLAEHITHLIFSPLCTSRITVLCERKREQRGVTGSRLGGPASWERSRLLDPAREGPHGGSAEPPATAPSLWRKGAPRGGRAQPAAATSPDGPRPGGAERIGTASWKESAVRSDGGVRRGFTGGGRCAGAGRPTADPAREEVVEGEARPGTTTAAAGVPRPGGRSHAVGRGRCCRIQRSPPGKDV